MVECTEDFQDCDNCPRERCSIRLFSIGSRVKRRTDIEKQLNEVSKSD